MRHHEPKALSKKGDIRAASRLLKAMAHPCRLNVLCALTGGEQCAGDLLQRTGLSQSAFSQHLSRLKDDDLVATRKDAQRIYYRIQSPEALELVRVLTNLFCPQPGSKHSHQTQGGCHDH